MMVNFVHLNLFKFLVKFIELKMIEWYVRRSQIKLKGILMSFSDYRKREKKQLTLAPSARLLDISP